MFAASPVTASIAVTSLDTMFSAVRFSSTFVVLSDWSLLPQAARASEAPAARIKRRIGDSETRAKKKEAAGITGSPLKRQRLLEGGVQLHRVVGRGVGGAVGSVRSIVRGSR